MHDLGREKLNKLFVGEDITSAETLSSSFYTEDEYFKSSADKIFSRCWHFAGDTSIVKVPGQVTPVTLLEDLLDEPVIFTRDSDDRINCLSNVCTHRGKVLVDGQCIEKNLRCRYHGRKFDLNGKMLLMPEFESARDFPSVRDNLPRIPFDAWGQFLFAAINPIAPLSEFMDEMFSRLSWMDIDRMRVEPRLSREYLVKCHWALYCENYLEGFHIPFVHNSLNDTLDYGSYKTELYPFSSLQLGIGKSADNIFEIPKDHADYGLNVSAYYFWVFPNLMFNFYPWGLSLNIVKPVKKDLTRVSFISYVLDESRLGKGAGAELDKVEREDEAIVEDVQRGIKSYFYDRGRYSPTRETGVHHFHRLICDFMNP
jgi:choline monooxygenase